MLVVEVESLVSQSFTSYPARIGDSLKKDQLNTLLSILEERAGFNLYNKNVILKTTGGLKISEQSVNLAVIISVASSILNKSVPRDNVFIAEVGLTGELKKVPNLSERLTELDRMRYKKVYTSNEVVDLKNLKTLKVEKSKTLKEVIDKVFRRSYWQSF